MKHKLLCVIMVLAMLLYTLAISALASDEVIDDAETNKEVEVNLELSVKSAILMDSETGSILYANNETEPLPLASVTKIMTLILVCEAIDNGSISLDQEVIVSNNAASMGGSQIFLEEGERFTVQELLKCTVIASANDAAVALAELVSGSEEEFVNKMNLRAEELGMLSTHFENCTGLDDTVTKHESSALDIAKMSRELLKHHIVLEYSSLWQDSIRGGEFTLTNTNRLVRYYKGCTGLKTGSTDKAGYCVSATAEREGMHLIAVVMGAETRDIRNDAARTLLDFGFANYATYKRGESAIESVPVKRGTSLEVVLYSAPVSMIVKRNDLRLIESVYDIPDTISAPIKAGESLGTVKYFLNGEMIGEGDIYSNETVPSINAFKMMYLILESFIK